jgi:hypothetical protein
MQEISTYNILKQFRNSAVLLDTKRNNFQDDSGHTRVAPQLTSARGLPQRATSDAPSDLPENYHFVSTTVNRVLAPKVPATGPGGHWVVRFESIVL